MPWLNLLKRDSVPWLLDPENPSARFLTLRDIFKKPVATLAVEQQAIGTWAPVQEIVQHWNRYNFWGRNYAPYYGGPVGNFGTLYLFAQLGTPLFPELEPVCENLLDVGRFEDGRFIPEMHRAAPWLCYTGMALRLLYHFGYGADSRVISAHAALVYAILFRPELLGCPMLGGPCRSGLVKALDALLHVPPAQRTADNDAAIEALSEQLLAHAYDWGGQDADWLALSFPRYYDADVLELCHVLAQTPYRTQGRFEELVQRMLALQNAQGRWRKSRATPAFSVERIQHPSRWLTYEAVHTLTLTYGDTVYAT